MFIKSKSIVVAAVSSIVVSAALVFTLIGYYMYIELKIRDDEKTSIDSLRKVQSQIFSKQIDVSQLTCAIEKSDGGRGRPTIRGIIKNGSTRDIYDIVLKVKFLDVSGASLYEVIFRPLEPTYGTNPIGHISQSHLLGYSRKNALKAKESNAFKRVILNSPKEILSFLDTRKGQRPASLKKSRAWTGSYAWEVISVSL